MHKVHSLHIRGYQQSLTVWHVNEFATCEIAEKKHVTHVQRYVTSIFVSCRQTMLRCNVPNNVAKLNCMFTNNLYGSHQ